MLNEKQDLCCQLNTSVIEISEKLKSYEVNEKEERLKLDQKCNELQSENHQLVSYVMFYEPSYGRSFLVWNWFHIF